LSEAKRAAALVTGASYGVGAATALALAHSGFDLVITATRESNLATTVAAIRETGRKAVGIELDLRAQSSIENTAAAAIAAFGRIDVLINNASVNLRSKAIETARDDFEDVLLTNVTGTFFLTQQFGRYWVAQHLPGRVVTIASAHALVGAAERSAYGISKAALLQMTRMLAIEWADYGITVNAVAPGRLDTDSPSRAGTGSNKDYMEAMLKRIPLHRLATAEEVAAAAAFLTGPAAASITGQTIVIDGGLTAA
jgi:NAD(P)-dependent dehydrogenase (short-subunit alcohol dehydrogenase family)